MQCNIDAKGKAVRLIWGLLALVTAIVLVVLELSGSLESAWWWGLAGLLAAIGGLGIVQAWAGWCVIRALGFKTPL